MCQITSEITLNRQTLGYTKKNLLKNTATTQTVNSVTFTVNEDGSVTVNGTATNAINIEISKHLQVDLLEDNIDYVLSGGSANAKIFMNLRDSNDVYIKTITQQSGSGFVFNKILLLETEGCSLYNLGIYVPNGSTHTNTTIYPMIRHASITDATYEPYVDDVDTRLKSLERESGGSGGTAGTTDYEDLSNKPSVNGVELSGNKTTSDLGITAESVGADAAGSASTALSNAKDYTDTKIADLVSGAPSTLDTLKEISDALAESGEAIEAINQAIGNKLDKNGDSKDNTVTFTQASTRENIASTEKHSTLFGKIAKWFADLKTVAFSGSYNDLSNKPAIPTKTSELENDSGFMGSATALDTYEEIMANTESGKFAGAKGVKEGFSAINDSLGGLRFGIDGDGNYGYYGADDSLIPFKSSKVIAILCRNSVANHTFAKGTPFNDLEYCTAVNSDADTVTKTVTFNKSCKVLLLHTLTAINNDHDSAVTITLNNEEIFTDSVSATTINSYKQIEFTTEVGDVLEIKYKSTNLAYIAGQAILLV